MNPIDSSYPNGANYSSFDKSTKKAHHRQFNGLIHQFNQTLKIQKDNILVTRETKKALKETLYALGTQFAKYILSENPITDPSFDQETFLAIRECIASLGNERNVFTKEMCERLRDITTCAIGVLPRQLKEAVEKLDDALAEKQTRLSSSPHVPSAPPLPSPPDTQNRANEPSPPPLSLEFKDELALKAKKMEQKIEERIEKNLNKEEATQKVSADKKKKPGEQQTTQKVSADKKKKPGEQQATQKASKAPQSKKKSSKKKGLLAGLLN